MADYVLPDLPYDYAALEPYISGQIMELHHSKHHNAYVIGINTAEYVGGAVRVTDVEPDPQVPAEVDAVMGDPVSFAVSTGDPGVGPYQLTMDWVDGTVDRRFDVPGLPSGYAVLTAPEHTYRSYPGTGRRSRR